MEGNHAIRFSDSGLFALSLLIFLTGVAFNLKESYVNESKVGLIII
jgi:hypothetical protein